MNTLFGAIAMSALIHTMGIGAQTGLIRISRSDQPCSTWRRLH